jgi:hypothetical protein
MRCCASCYAASAVDIQLLGDNAGQETLKLVQPVRAVRSEARALAEFGGVNVHAEVAIDGRDRQRLEHVFLALHGAQKRSDEHLCCARIHHLHRGRVPQTLSAPPRQRIALTALHV